MKKAGRTRDYLDQDGNPLPWGYGRPLVWFGIYMSPVLAAVLFVHFFPYRSQGKDTMDLLGATIIIAAFGFRIYFSALRKAYPENITPMSKAEEARKKSEERERNWPGDPNDPY